MSTQPIHIELKDELLWEKNPLRFTAREPIRAHACGKLILVGEHAVVYGAHAVAVPVPNMQLEIILQSLQNKSPHYWHTTNKAAPTSDNLKHVLQDALDLLQLESFPLKIEGHSRILMGAGLGASAALCVAILRALCEFFDKKINPFELASLANQLEKRFHGTPSGLDATTVALEQAILFKKNKKPQSLHIQNIVRNRKSFAWQFAILDSDTRSPTLTMVQQSAPFFQREDAQNRITRFDKLALQTAEGLENGNLSLVQNSLETAHELLQEIGVVPNSLTTMINEAKTCGALTAKITGAGGGGCILCLLDPENAENTLNELQRHFGKTKVHPLVLSQT